MTRTNSTIITKGIFAIAVIAVAGTVGAINFAQAAPGDPVSGYGTTSEQAIAAADAFQNGLSTEHNDFTADVEALLANARAQLASDGAVDNFDAQFDAASAAYENDVNQAFNDFRMKVTEYGNTAESKDQFIDWFNNAKADYFNQLDAAKNQLAAALSPMGHNANVVKDQFMNGYNSARDQYGNDLEALKNQFAATVSNL